MTTSSVPHSPEVPLAARIDALCRTARRDLDWSDVAGVVAAGGPVFGDCAGYLSTRLDLLPADVAAFLAQLPAWSVLLGPTEVPGALSRALGRPLEQVFDQFETMPFETRFPVQCHRARLGQARAVVVRLVVPGARDVIADVGPLLRRFLPVVARLGDNRDRRYLEAALQRAAEDYLALLGRRLDLVAEVAGGRAIAADARQFPLLRARRPHQNLSGRDVSVWDDLATVPLDAPGADRPLAAATAMVVWLRQSLLGRGFPEEPQASDFQFVGRGEVALVHGLCRAMPTTHQITLQSYLVATAVDEPDWAFDCVTKLVTPTPAADRTTLQRRFRHAQPGGSSAGSALLAQLVTHWQLIGRHGFEPLPELATWYRACAMATAAAASHGAEGDVLHEALRTLQPRIAARRVGRLVGMPDWQGRSPGEVLSRAAGVFAINPADVLGGSLLNASRPPPRTGVIAGLLMVVASVAFVVPSLDRLLGRTIAGSLGGAAVLGAGAAALWLIMRARGRTGGPAS